MGSYYFESMSHATCIWVFILLSMGIFIKCKHESDTKMSASKKEEEEE